MYLQGSEWLESQECVSHSALVLERRTWREGPLALLWPVVGEERRAGWGVFIYSLGFVCPVYVSH